MENVIVILILVAITGLIVRYLINEKKKGKACVGCPYSGGCTKASCESLDSVKIKVNE